MTQSKSAATKRLLRDLREWKNCCHLAKCISAAPLENDIFEWHINFIPDDGPLKDIIFHLVMRFPDNYPLHHPYVTLKNYLNHPNVFITGDYGHHTKCGTGYWICLDMIKCSNWSAAYSVSSILMQLLSFLITAKAPQEYGEDKIVTHSQVEIEKMKTESMQFECNGCNHTFHKPFPSPYLSINPSLISSKSMQKIDNNHQKQEINYWAKYMHQDVENIIIDFLNIADLLILGKVCCSMKSLVFASKSARMAKFSCWYNKVDLRYSQYIRQQTNTSSNNINDPVAKELILGYGITPIFYQGASRVFKSYFREFDSELIKHNGLEFRPLRQCEITFDLLSKDAFEISKIRQTPMNDKQFTHWIPMYIAHGKYHGIESLKILKYYTLQIFQINIYHPFMTIHLICSVMSTLVVKLMEAIKASKLHHSINVLETYFHFYHLLLAVYYKYYNILHPLIQQKCINFIIDINKRTKTYVPNLGNFMIWFTLCDNIPSKYIFESLLEEGLIRNQRWIIKKFGSGYEDKSAQHFGINQAFMGAQVSKRLFMFQYFFMKKICGLGSISPAQKFKELNQSLGCINESISLRLQSFCKKLDKIKNFKQFFDVIEMKYPGDKIMKKWLRKSVDMSAERGYHIPSKPIIRKSYNYEEEGSEFETAFDSFNYSVFFDAVNKNDINTVIKLLGEPNQSIEENKCNIDIKSMDINNICWDKLNRNNMINQFVSENNIIFDKKMTDKCGYSPLFIAANKSYLDMVKLLISYGFDVNIMDKNEQTAINYTTNKEIIELITNEQNKTKCVTKNMGFCASKYIEITRIPPECDLCNFNKDNIRIMFKRYGFNAHIKDDCIEFKENCILIKLREYKINDKIRNIARCFCFGQKIKAQIYELTDFNNNVETNMYETNVSSSYVNESVSSSSPFKSRFPSRINSNGNSNGYVRSTGYNNRYNMNNNNGYNSNYSNNYGHNNNRNSYGYQSRGYNNNNNYNNRYNNNNYYNRY